MTHLGGPVACLLLAVAGGLASHQVAAAPAPGSASGEELYVTGCSGCHGLDGGGLRGPEGLERGPDLTGSGEAGAYYYLTTGRMPLSDPDQQPVRKEPAYTPEEIDALVAYVGDLGEGPPIPQLAVEEGDLAGGGEIYRAQCAACHSATGAGGALSYGRAAPSLGQSSPRQVVAAVRVGPGQMPVFGEESLPDEQMDDLARYVQYLRQPQDRGGLALGGLGPVPEGFLVWVLGIGLLLGLSAWISHRPHRDDRTTSP